MGWDVSFEETGRMQTLGNGRTTRPLLKQWARQTELWGEFLGNTLGEERSSTTALVGVGMISGEHTCGLLCCFPCNASPEG